ncbi:LADA_0G07514g1_1 [Lachancea dasiensis]|uniref:LADA_0G07514g1_1 n=1 Tax=Lachancea dasiensis TaxID=1072105 RepID=A0A1G4JTQ0_9SACH|nr:LADA_0G07514g1_1 [Lachancea dasiensis]
MISHNLPEDTSRRVSRVAEMSYSPNGGMDSNSGPSAGEDDAIERTSAANAGRKCGSSATRDAEPPRTTTVYQDDISEIVVGVKRLVASHEEMGVHVQQVDTKVTQTQLDLDGLVTRSANNNKHLQSLLLSTQDVRKLQELLERLPSADQRQRPQPEPEPEPEPQRQELEWFRRKHTSLDALDEQIAQKQLELSSLQGSCELVHAKLASAQREFEKLRVEYRELDSRIDQALFDKCKAVETNLAVSAASFLPPRPGSGVPATKMSRITDMLRQRQPNTRRVMSFNVADTYHGYAASNNSDENVAGE